MTMSIGCLCPPLTRLPGRVTSSASASSCASSAASARAALRLFQGLFQGGADLIGQLSHGGALLGGEFAHLLEYGGELALLAEVLYPQRLKRFGVRGAGDGGCGFGPELFQHLFHFVSDFPFRSCGTHKKTAPRPIQDERPLFRGTTRYSARDAPHSSL